MNLQSRIDEADKGGIILEPVNVSSPSATKMERKKRENKNLHYLYFETFLLLVCAILLAYKPNRIIRSLPMYGSLSVFI